MKKSTRIIAGLASASLLGLTPLALSAPANAAETLASTVSFDFSKTSLVYGESTYASGNVVGSDGASVLGGTATLFEMTSKSGSWNPIAVDESPGYLFFDNVKPRTNAAYKVVYSGFTSTSQYSDSYLASESGVVSIGVVRKVTIKKAKKGLAVIGKVKPKYKRSKVKIQIKKGKRWKKYKTVRTNKKSQFRVNFHSRRGGRIYFRITVPGNKHYSQYREVWYTYRY